LPLVKAVKAAVPLAAAARRPTKAAARPARDGSAARRQPSAPSQPIYQRIAADLRLAISGGTYPVGSRLPTEHELCAQFGISRFTARAAIRLLSTAGLVTRKQRIGTVVIALPGDARYSQDVASLPDLFQYAQDTELRLVYVGKVTLTRAMARDFGATPGEEWVYAMGLRHEGRGGERGKREARPICITRIFLNPQLKGIETKLRGRRTAIYAMIEREYKVSIQRVEQELHGAVLDADDASNLQTAPGAPALRIVRRYYSDQGVLLEVADNLHPSDRFIYRMELRK
jgi:DNA-binding GntR family transcriptional regulator